MHSAFENNPRGARLSWAILSCWALAAFLFLTLLSRAHQAPLPAPETGPARLQLAATGRWHLVHFLVPGCICSERVADYLAGRRPGAGIDEEVTVLGPLPRYAAGLAAAGWPVRSAAPGSPAACGVEGGPWLLIADPAGQVRYSGGYLGRTIDSSADPFQDLALLGRLRRGESPLPLAVFGCAASGALQKRIDPLGLNTARAD